MNSTQELTDSKPKQITLKDILDTVQEIKESCAKAQRSLHGVIAMGTQK